LKFNEPSHPSSTFGGANSFIPGFLELVVRRLALLASFAFSFTELCKLFVSRVFVTLFANVPVDPQSGCLLVGVWIVLEILHTANMAISRSGALLPCSLWTLDGASELLGGLVTFTAVILLFGLVIII
jgi:hypothetical protein